jgi:hypothetical protein
MSRGEVKSILLPFVVYTGLSSLIQRQGRYDVMQIIVDIVLCSILYRNNIVTLHFSLSVLF